MGIPALNEFGLLPEGVHDSSIEDVQKTFGRFQQSERRPRLWAALLGFISEAKKSQIVEAIIFDGSFVTSNPNPNDIDLIVVVPAGHDFAADLELWQYNVLDQNRVRKRFGLDIVVVTNATENLDWAITFFQQVRQHPGLKKGLLRVSL